MEATSVFVLLAMQAMDMTVRGFKKFAHIIDLNPQEIHPCIDLNHPNKRHRFMTYAVTALRMLPAKMGTVFAAADSLVADTIAD